MEKTAELKRALVAELSDYMSEPTAEDLLMRLLAKLAAGSPEVIEAMARADCFVGCNRGCSNPGECTLWGGQFAEGARAALAAGMKVIAEGGK